ncbi:unnamed protein product [Rhizoctonia solani]|uniref:Ricin B lectin domain-containing protein n=1 Tax=Rhizoctonia solani TaxID=456999 RepID=A0A8H3D4P3_9AGAM|nr:unnamed protein product [Rhizoctonia solani]
MKPGTYKIVNLASGTAMTDTGSGVVGQRKGDTQRQQWFAQQSGEGYQFKNVGSGGYLALMSTDDHRNELYCGVYPTTWKLTHNPHHTGQDTHGMMMGDTDRILDLGNWGSSADGTRIHGFSHSRHNASTIHRVWKFERINDQTGEVSPELAKAKEELSRAQNTIQTQATEIEFLRKLLLDSRQKRSVSPQEIPNNMT